MTIEKAKKKSIKLKSIEEVNYSKVVGFGVVGLFVGAVAGVALQIANLDIKKGEPLDPPAPCMEIIDPEMASLYRKFMGEYYAKCPDFNQKIYKRRVRRSIKHAEAVMLIGI